MDRIMTECIRGLLAKFGPEAVLMAIALHMEETSGDTVSYGAKALDAAKVKILAGSLAPGWKEKLRIAFDSSPRVASKARKTAIREGEA